jgi:hypothetical protein
MRGAVERGTTVEEKEIMPSSSVFQHRATLRYHSHTLDPCTFAVLGRTNPETGYEQKAKEQLL